MRTLYLLLFLALVACGPHKSKTHKPNKTTESVETPVPHQPPAVEPEPVEPEPVEPEPVEPEPVKPEPVKPEPVKPEPVKPEPVKPEPVKPEPVKPEPVKPEPVKPEPVEPRPVELDTQNKQSISGVVTYTFGKVRDQTIEPESTVIFFKPSTPIDADIPVQDHQIVTQNKRFIPNVLAVTVGSTVRFPNQDRILHNVFSVTKGSEFDLGLYKAGVEKSVTFDRAGIKYIHCNVHHSMQADVIVLDTPWFTVADEQGRYQLSNLPQVAGKLYAWHPRAGLSSKSLPSDQDHNFSLNITRAKVPKHLNKFGQSYRAKRE